MIDCHIIIAERSRGQLMDNCGSEFDRRENKAPSMFSDAPVTIVISITCFK